MPFTLGAWSLTRSTTGLPGRSHLHDEEGYGCGPVDGLRSLESGPQGASCAFRLAMATGPTNEGTARRTDRLEAFSDAVLAIAITLPVVELHAPRPGSGPLAEGYLKLAPEYAAYVASVVVIGVYWAHSHFSGKLIVKTDHGFNLLSVAFLAAVSLTPFPMRPLFEHLAGDGDSRTATLALTGVLALPATFWAARWFYAVSQELPDPTLDPAYVRRASLKYMWSVVAAYAAVFLSIWSWPCGLIVGSATVLIYLLPPLAPEFKPGQEPEDELEEADERR